MCVWGWGGGGGSGLAVETDNPPHTHTHTHTHTRCIFFFSFAKPFPAFWSHSQCNLSTNLHLGTFVICFLLFHTDADEKCGMWVNLGREDVRVGF